MAQLNEDRDLYTFIKRGECLSRERLATYNAHGEPSVHSPSRIRGSAHGSGLIDAVRFDVTCCMI